MVHESQKAIDAVGAGDQAPASSSSTCARSNRSTRRRSSQSAKKTGKVLVVTEANGLCSVASEVAAMIGEEAFAYLDAPVMRVAAPDVPAMPFSPPLEHAFMVDAEKIGAALRRL